MAGRTCGSPHRLWPRKDPGGAKQIVETGSFPAAEPVPTVRRGRRKEAPSLRTVIQRAIKKIPNRVLESPHVTKYSPFRQHGRVRTRASAVGGERSIVGSHSKKGRELWRLRISRRRVSSIRLWHQNRPLPMSDDDLPVWKQRESAREIKILQQM
jgi:hypothetical protein